MGEKMHDELSKGDTVEVMADPENWADNKIRVSCERDIIACKGLKVTYIIGIIIVIAGYAYTIEIF